MHGTVVQKLAPRVQESQRPILQLLQAAFAGATACQDATALVHKNQIIKHVAVKARRPRPPTLYMFLFIYICNMCTLCIAHCFVQVQEILRLMGIDIDAKRRDDPVKYAVVVGCLEAVTTENERHDLRDALTKRPVPTARAPTAKRQRTD